MPFDVHRAAGGGYTVRSKVSGRTAHVKDQAGLRGYIWHAEHANGDPLHRAVQEVRKSMKRGKRIRVEEQDK